MAITDGQPVNQAASNAAWVSATQDDTKVGVLTLNAGPMDSGVPVTDSQKEHNAIASFVGKALNSVYNLLPTWTANEGFASASDTVVVRVEAISAKFDKDTGHTHDGSDGGGGSIALGAVVQVDDSEGSPDAITAVGGIPFSSSKAVTVKFIIGDGAPIDISANPQIAAGSTIGQILVLVGSDDTDYVLIEDGTGLGSNGPCELGEGKVWAGLWTGSVWREIFRSA